MAENALGALLVTHALGADPEASAAALAGFAPPKGRGERISLADPRGLRHADRRELQRQSGLDAGRAQAARRGGARTQRAPDRGDRRHAGARRRRRGDACGARRRPRRQQGRSPVRGGAADARALRRAPPRRSAPAGPSGRARSPTRSRRRFAPATSPWSRDRTAAGWGRWSPRCANISPVRAREAKTSDADLALRLAPSSGRLPTLPLADLPHPRRGGDGAVSGDVLRPDDHLAAAAEAGQGPADPRQRARLASSDQEGDADHGRADDPVRAHRLFAAVGGPGEPVCVDRPLRHLRLRGDRLLRRLSQGDEAVAPRLLRPRAARRRICDRGDRLLGDDAGRRTGGEFARACRSSRATCSISAGASCCSARS